MLQPRGMSAQWWFHRHTRPLDQLRHADLERIPEPFELLHRRGKPIPLAFELKSQRAPESAPEPTPAPASPPEKKSNGGPLSWLDDLLA